MCQCMGECLKCSPKVNTKPVPHKHAALIKAWADCPETVFQFRGGGLQSNYWYTMKTPDWTADEIRIKPTPKPDSIKNVYLSRVLYPGLEHLVKIENKVLRNNVQCIFDGETGKLKSVSIINS